MIVCFIWRKFLAIYVCMYDLWCRCSAKAVRFFFILQQLNENFGSCMFFLLLLYLIFKGIHIDLMIKNISEK